ncbi:MAG: NACHT domain-containing protein [Tissierellales bacterium]|nr:NACHT domain-containing protein [Tissierellales bacterium]
MDVKPKKILPISPESISRFKKEKFLRTMSEDRFRDEVVRPLFFRQGFKDGRDLCGRYEQGKDAIFVTEDKLGFPVLYVVQTKIGNLNLSKKITQSIVEAKTQLLTALETRVIFTLTKEKLSPTYAILCTNGKINESARTYLIDEVGNPHIRFIDIDDLIPKIDDHYPELWIGIDADKFPYLKNLRKKLLDSLEDFAISDILPNKPNLSSVADGMFVELHLNRQTIKLKRESGKVKREIDFEQISASNILKRKEQHFVISGEAGSGKSTLIRRLAYILVEDALTGNEIDIEIPVLLKSAEVHRSEENIVEICNSSTAQLSMTNKSVFNVKDLADGKITLFIDALDELANNEERQYVLDKLNEFMTQYPNCTIILTSRDYSFISELEDLKKYLLYRLSPIDWKEAQLIIKRLHQGKPLKQETAQEILRRLQEVHGIELNPLLVTVFVATSDYSRKDIPANITELFKKFTEMMLGRWDVSKGLDQQYHAPLKDFLLRQLAFEMHRRGITLIPLEECRKILGRELLTRGKSADIDLLTDEIIYRSGMFRFIDDKIEFRHFLLQEFFAGRGVPSAEFLQSVISNEWWQRAIIFYFGENPSDHVTLEHITDTVDVRTEEEIFKAAIAIGLALQACYLIKTSNRIKIFKWVIRGLCSVKSFLLTDSNTETIKYPLMRFLSYYLFGRDAVACEVLSENSDNILQDMLSEQGLFGDGDLIKFWIIVGLLECGCLSSAEQMIKSFRPKDLRLLLAIHLGCFLIENLKVTSTDDKKIASKITNNLTQRIIPLRNQIVEEMKSELLEVQRGEIRSLAPVDGK